MNAVLRNLYDNIINLLYEPQCPFEVEAECSINDYYSPGIYQGKVCNFCFNEFVDLNVSPREGLENLQKVYASAEYKDNCKTIIKKLKWSNPKLAGPIAELMHYKLTCTAPFLEFDSIVPVPGMPDEESTGAHSVLLAKELAKIYRKPFWEPLKKLKETNLHKCAKLQRKEVIQGAYALKQSSEMGAEQLMIKPKTVLLVDDIVTTGITLSTCAGLIKQLNNSNQIFAVTYASVTST
ncbi:MAG: hypothetical protein SFU25_11975 [Candidatus Caenarcaniphilales bacterium]|nr:hypothetical protein [Candidatus Caenarcaniphilales bacterium]